MPERSRLYADMARLFAQDLANVEAGIYPLPADHDGSLPKLLARSRLFFADLPEVHRREQDERQEVLSEETRGKRPGYYLQEFPLPVGRLADRGIGKLYDTQVEVLFKGTANATRRQALVPLHEVFAGRDQRQLKLIDVGCGTGRFLDFCKQAWPRLPALGVDLSEAYVAEAKGIFDAGVGSISSSPTAKPYGAGRQPGCGHQHLHVSTSCRRRCVGRWCANARACSSRRPLILIDSLQIGDQPDYDGVLELFPQSYHEPLLRQLSQGGLRRARRRRGLTHTRSVNAFVSKVMVFDKR